MTPPRIELIGVGKDFPSGTETVRVLQNVDLTVEPGESVAITGPSGSGKSTLLAMIAGLERPSAGRIRRDGAAADDWTEEELAVWRRRRVGFVFQNFRLMPTLTALENASFPLELLGVPPGEAAATAGALLRDLGLAGRESHRPSMLSGGEQQRVALARAYAHRPALILADEPTGSLDRTTSGRVLDALLAAHARSDAALVVVTHDPAVASRLSRRIVIDGGRLSE